MLRYPMPSQIRIVWRLRRHWLRGVGAKPFSYDAETQPGQRRRIFGRRGINHLNAEEQTKPLAICLRCWREQSRGVRAPSPDHISIGLPDPSYLTRPDSGLQTVIKRMPAKCKRRSNALEGSLSYTSRKLVLNHPSPADLRGKCHV